MTLNEAFAEAKRRWRWGSVRGPGDEGEGCKVGYVPFGSFRLTVYGTGATWEEAFADADANDHV